MQEQKLNPNEYYEALRERSIKIYNTLNDFPAKMKHSKAAKELTTEKQKIKKIMKMLAESYPINRVMREERRKEGLWIDLSFDEIKEYFFYADCIDGDFEIGETVLVTDGQENQKKCFIDDFVKIFDEQDNYTHHKAKLIFPDRNVEDAILEE